MYLGDRFTSQICCKKNNQTGGAPDVVRIREEAPASVAWPWHKTSQLGDAQFEGSLRDRKLPCAVGQMGRNGHKHGHLLQWRCVGVRGETLMSWFLAVSLPL